MWCQHVWSDHWLECSKRVCPAHIVCVVNIADICFPTNEQHSAAVQCASGGPGARAWPRGKRLQPLVGAHVKQNTTTHSTSSMNTMLDFSRVISKNGLHSPSHFTRRRGRKE
eukprot:TRINITY_DN1754_c0_g1_i1.p3 TRINITY_DN1754_c0_g1~~TRINITY_DN1754_c0_g1_i1.p3  ORF type:complete len:112 (-),score=5.02 TRINITY_DN1754_c0_g1_i1:629-964(-)